MKSVATIALTEIEMRWVSFAESFKAVWLQVVNFVMDIWQGMLEILLYKGIDRFLSRLQKLADMLDLDIDFGAVGTFEN